MNVKQYDIRKALNEIETTIQNALKDIQGYLPGLMAELFSVAENAGDSTITHGDPDEIDENLEIRSDYLSRAEDALATIQSALANASRRIEQERYTIRNLAKN